jgi:RecA/RadA recombinase
MAPKATTEAGKWMNRLRKHEATVKRDYNPFAHIIRYSSPYLNWVFGNTHGLPRGKKLIVYGPDKSGKTVTCYDMIGQMHRDYPEAIAVRYDTEFRDDAQLTPAMAAAYGIDMDRYICYQTNSPSKIFDHITKEIGAMCEDGAPIYLIIIDSIAMIKGRRSENADTVDTQQMGDQAKTIQDGLTQILETLHKYRIALVMTNQVRDEFDRIEKMRNPYRMWGAWFLKHFAEYKLLLAPVNSKEGMKTLTGVEMVDTTVTDVMDKNEQLGHKIRATMKNSSLGPKNRRAEFTFDYKRGIINRHEDAFLLGLGRNIIETPNNKTYVLRDFPVEGKQSEWVGKVNFIMALQKNEDACKAILERVRSQDIDLMEKGSNSTFYRADESVAEDDDGDADTNDEE